MKNYGQMFSEKALEMTTLMSEARRELMIEKFEMIHCVACESLQKKLHGVYEAIACMNPATPLYNKWSSNEEDRKKFDTFACPMGREKE